MNGNGFSSQRKYLLRLGFGHCSPIALPHTRTITQSHMEHARIEGQKHVPPTEPKKTKEKKRKTILLMLNSLDQIDYGFLSLIFSSISKHNIIYYYSELMKAKRKNCQRKSERTHEESKKMCVRCLDQSHQCGTF